MGMLMVATSDKSGTGQQQAHRWEYQAVTAADLHRGLRDLSEAGDDGWELVDVVRPADGASTYTFILKRADE